MSKYRNLYNKPPFGAPKTLKHYQPKKSVSVFLTLIFNLLLFSTSLQGQCNPDTTPPTINCPSNMTVSTDPASCDAVVNWNNPTQTDNCSSAQSGATVLNFRQSSSTRNPNSILTNMGFAVTNVVNGNYDAVGNQLNSQSWDLAIIQIRGNSLTSGDLTAISNHIAGGGKIIMSYWDMTGTSGINPASGPALQPIMGISNAVSFNAPKPFTAWATSHPIFNNPNVVTSIAVAGDNAGIDNGDRLEPDATSTVLGGFVATPTANQGAIILGNNGNTFFHGFASQDMDAQEWFELIENEAKFLFGLTFSQTAGLASGSTYPVGATTNTLQAIDGSGNTANCSFMVTVNDNEKPNAVCQNISIDLDASGNKTINANQLDNGSSDNCATNFSASKTSFSCSDIGSNSVTLTVSDGNGNSETCTSTVTVNDPLLACCAAPDAKCKDISVNLDASGNVTISGAQIDNGSTVDCGTPGLSANPSSLNCTNIGTNSVTLTVTDDSGSTDNCTSIVTISDNEDPTAVCQNISIDLDGSGNKTINANELDNGSSDNCATNFSASKTSFSCADIGANSVTLTVSDGNGNSETCTSTVTVNDSEKPTPVCQNISIDLDGSGNATITAAQLDNGSSDNCGTTNFSASKTSFSCADIGANSVTLTVSDGNGNSETCSSTVTVNDSEKPTAVCQNISIDLDGSGNATITAAQLDNGSSDNCGTTNFSASKTSFSCADIGSNSVTLTVSDGNGNSETCSSTVTVNDSEKPNAICQNIDVQLDASNNASISGAQIDDNSTDNCGISTRTAFPNTFSCNDIGPNSVTLTVSDGNGNSETCTATVTVKDDVNPCCAAPDAKCKPFTASLDANGSVTIFASDVDDNSTADCGLQSSTIDLSSFDCSTVGTPQSVKLTIVDINNDSDECTATVTVQDPTAPQITCPSDMVVNNDPGECTAVISYSTPVGTDNCTPTTTQIQGISDGGEFPVGITTNTFEVTDGSQTAQCSFTVEVNDVEAPVITYCPGDILQDTDQGNCDAVVTFDPITAMDNCVLGSQGVLKTFYNEDNGQRGIMFDIEVTGTEPVFVRKFDANLYSGTSTYEIWYKSGTYQGSQNNSANWTKAGRATGVTSRGRNRATPIPIDIDVWIQPGETYGFYVTNTSGGGLSYTNGGGHGVVFASNSHISVSGGLGKSYPFGLNFNPRQFNGTIHYGSLIEITQTEGLASGSTFPLGNTPMSFDVTDEAGNTSVCDFDVDVEDNEVPDAKCQDISVELDAGGNAAISMAQIDNGSSDACGTVKLTSVVPSSFTCSNVGSNTVTLSMNDGNGNATSCDATVTVEDNTLPTANCQDATVQLDANGNASIFVAQIDDNSTDNCGTVNLTSVSPNSFTCLDLGVNTVTLFMNDGNGNATSCDATVTVEDVIPPTAHCVHRNISLSPDGTITVLPEQVDNASFDNCGTVNLTSLVPNYFTCADLGYQYVTLSIDDGNGNTSSCTATLTIKDGNTPTSNCQDATVQLDATGDLTISPNLVDAGNIDNCSSTITTSVIPDYFTCTDIGFNTVTLYLEDESGNISTCQATVTVEDDTAPTASCQDITVPLNANGMAAITAAQIDNESADNCGTVNLTSVVPNNFTCSDLGANTVTLSMNDGNGNDSSCTATVTVEDDENPTIVCPADVSVDTDAGTCEADGIALGNPSTSDNCSGETTTNDAPTIFPKGSTIVTWTVTDASNNTDVCTQTITVSDNENPVIVCPANVSVDTDAGTCEASVLAGMATVSDNCPGATVSSDNSLTIFPKGSTIVTWTATDAANNTTVCTQTITVSDTENPMIVCPTDVYVDMDLGDCQATNVSLGTASASDNCPNESVSNDALAAYAKGTTTVTWTVIDASQNEMTCVQMVTVSDTENPTIICPADVSVDTDAGTCEASVSAGVATVSDNCPGATVSSDNSLTIFPKGSTMITWTATDAENNTATCTQTITVSDTENPVIVCPADVSVDTEAGTCEASVLAGMATVSDNCSGATVSSDNSLTIFPKGSTMITWTATDAANNTAVCTQTITVSDNENPTIVCPADVSVDTDAGTCEASVLAGMATVSDNCPGATVSSDNSLTVFPKGSIMITWTATDAANNTAVCTQTITVLDTENPTITCPTDVYVDMDLGDCQATNVSLGTASASDNCPNESVSNDALAAYAKGTTTVTWTVIDASQNEMTCVQMVTVSDNENPMIICPADVSVDTDAGTCEASVSAGVATVSDNCSGVTVSSDNSLTIFPKGSTMITWTAIDAENNAATCTQTITVSDTENPVIVCPADVSVDTEAGTCEASVLAGMATVSDNCPGATVSSDNSLTIFPKGSTMITWTATDAANNTAVCTQTITVSDTENPTIICPADVSADTDAGTCEASVLVGTATVSDNCPGATATSDNSLTVFPKGSTMITWTATDAANNTAVCTQTITVSDNENPTIICPADVSVDTEAGTCEASVLAGVATVSDNCPGATVSSDNSLTIFPKGSIMITWTATDAANNTAVCTQTITVSDNENPMIICPADVSADTDVGTCEASVLVGTATVSDNCPGVTATSDNSLTVFPKGSTMITWAATDAANNTAVCTQTITVSDNENPMIVCPADVSVDTDAGTCEASVLAGVATVSDNCPGATATSDNSLTVFPKGSTMITWTATDAANNTAVCTQTITVSDNENPVITQAATAQTVECDGSGNAVGLNAWLASNGGATATDNCSVSWSNNFLGFSNVCGNTGVANVTFTATDDAGNSSSTTATFTIEDTQKPIFNQYPTDLTMSCSGTIPTVAVVTATDICNGLAPSVDFAEAIIDQQCAGTYTIQRTWTAADACGNTETHVQNISVQDTDAPVFARTPSSVTIIECNDLVTGIPSALNLVVRDCDPNASVVNIVETEVLFNPNTAPIAGATRQVTRDYFAADDCGNTSSVTEIFYIVDTEAPTLLSCPDNVEIVVERGEYGAFISFPEPEFSDDCGFSTSTTSTAQSGDWLPALETVVIEVQAVDNAGNTTVCSFTVTATDELVVSRIDSIGVAIMTGDPLSTNTVYWNPIFAKPCDECAQIEADLDFQTAFEFLGELDGHRYFVSKTRVNTSDAVSLSSQFAGSLTSINSAKENRFLNNELGSREVLIGLNDAAVEGAFVWSDGSDSTYRNWGAGHPIADLTVAAMTDFATLSANGEWLNVQSGNYYFVLELPCYQLEKGASTMSANHDLTLGNYEIGYNITDICGNEDTATVKVNVVDENVEYCYPNKVKSIIDFDDHHFISVIGQDNRMVVSQNNDGYYALEKLFAEFDADKTYNLQLASSNDLGTAPTMYYRIWIDYNADGDFYDANELIFEEFTATGNIQKLQFTVPADVETTDIDHPILMRVAARKYDFPEPCGDYPFGETEDYPIRVIGKNSSSKGSLSNNGEITTTIETGIAPSMEVFPNPANEHVFVNLNQLPNHRGTLRISNQLGKVYYEKAIDNAAEETIRIDLENYPNGVYSVNLSDGKQFSMTQKLVVLNRK